MRNSFIFVKKRKIKVSMYDKMEEQQLLQC